MMLMNQDGKDAVEGVVTLDLVFTAGTSGAVPSTLTISDGIAKVTKSGTTYVITLQDCYGKFLNVTGTAIQASYAAGGAAHAIPLAAATNSGTPSVTIAFLAGDGSGQVALATGDEAHVTLRLAY